MSKKKKTIEFRYYEIPGKNYVLAMLGKGWEQEYGFRDMGKLHFHNYLEIGYCYNGHGNLVITDNVYRYNGDTITFIPANIPHTTVSDKGNICKWEFLFIDVERFIKNEMMTFPIPADEIIDVINLRGLFLKKSENRNIAFLIHQIIEECRMEQPYFEEGVKGYLTALITEVFRMEQEHARVTKNISTNIGIEKGINFIKEHFQEEIRIADVARNSGLSESHFRRIFEETTEMTPVDFVNRERIDMACELIIKKDISMADIGRMVGYQNANTFIRNFKLLTGLTPLQWKNSAQKRGMNLNEYRVVHLKGWEA